MPPYKWPPLRPQGRCDPRVCAARGTHAFARPGRIAVVRRHDARGSAFGRRARVPAPHLLAIAPDDARESRSPDRRLPLRLEAVAQRVSATRTPTGAQVG